MNSSTKLNHDFVKTGDTDVFHHICDRNGEVVLKYCRACGQGEGQLSRLCEPWARLQKQVVDWAIQNYGPQIDWQPLLGLIEECSEFVEARNILRNRADMADAIADQCIYALNLCSVCDIDFAQFVADVPPYAYSDAQILRVLGAACHAVLKTAQGIRGFNHDKRREHLLVTLGQWFAWVKHQCDQLSLKSPLENTIEIWEQVRKRDWRNHPEDAHKIAASEKQVSHE